MVHPVRQMRRITSGRNGTFVDDLVNDGGDVVAGKRLPTCQQFIQHGPQRKNVGPVIHFFSRDLLGRHVIGRPHHHARLGHGGGRYTGDPEVHDVRFALGVDQNVARLDVPVHDAFPVGVIERIGDGRKNAVDFLQSERPPRSQDVLQALSVDVLHGDEGQSLIHPHLIDGHNVGMGQVPGRARLPQKPPLGMLLLAGMRQLVETNGFDGHGPLDVRILCPVDDAHGTPSQFTADSVLADIIHKNSARSSLPYTP